jgi:2-methylcitrate dehydratase PrpD
MNAEYALAKNLLTVNYRDIPREVTEHTKKQVLDILGVMLGGSSRPGVKELAGLIQEWGGKEESTLFCYGNKVPAPNAAQVNATMGHALDYDDTGDGPTHPSVVIVPTALAMAEYKGKINGKNFIAAVALGVDMMCRLGQAFRLGQHGIPMCGHPGGGWNLTTLYGYRAAAGTAGRILGLDEKKLVNAMGIAYHQCSGKDRKSTRLNSSH